MAWYFYSVFGKKLGIIYIVFSHKKCDTKVEDINLKNMSDDAII